MMSMLVTGATGFIGYRLVKRLREKGNHVICLVRKESNIEKLKPLGVEIVECNILDLKRLVEVFKDKNPDYVFHCAAKVVGKNEDEIMMTNVEGTSNICKVSLDNDVKRMVYLSSIAVITGNDIMPLTDSLPYKATNAYGRSKIEAEKIVISYRENGLKIAILRPCMVYGEDEPHALDDILCLVEKHAFPYPSIEDIKDKLHLVYVDNVVDAIELALEKEGALEGTFIVADKEVLTVRSFLEIISGELGVKPPGRVPGWIVKALLVIPPMKKIYNKIFKDREYDISRLIRVLGYNPGVSAEEALKRTVRYWRDKRAKCVVRKGSWGFVKSLIR